MSEDSTRISRLQREVHRLRTSPSLRLGAHITDSIRKPWRAPFLIVTLPWMMLLVGLELIGLKSQPTSFRTFSSDGSLQKRECVVMFPTNGVGFGHFTRMLALAKRMKSKNKNLEVIFFTTMPTLHLLKPYGIPAHHFSGQKYFTDLSSEEWNALIEEELCLCFDFHRPSMFIFDGAFPYRGMLRAIQGRTMMKKIWMRRGTFRRGSSIPVDSINHFDTIIYPEDSVKTEHNMDDAGVEILTCPPIVLLDQDELLTREQARSRLMLPKDSRVIYLQLGAGEINDIESELRLTIDALLEYPDIHVVLGESMIGNRIDIELDRVHILRDYPNSMYFRGFDATIQAGGYNSFHETRSFGLPALFYPNICTGMDNQLARCKVAENEGWGIVLNDRTQEKIQQSCNQLLANIGTVSSSESKSGAWELAEMILKTMGVNVDD